MNASTLSRKIPITGVFAFLVACALVGAYLLWPEPLRSAPDQLNLPATLAKYTEWTALLKSPSPVPLELWIRCVAPTPTDLEQAREKYGPHNDHYIQVYANRIATQTILKGKSGLFQTGAVISKEKLMNSPKGTVVGVAFMIKRNTAQFASTGGWEFAYYPRSGDSESIQGCATCHRSVASNDYVFGHYPSSGDDLHPIQNHSR
jgi:Cytochrome P460